ncbi:anthranilate synthase component I [Rhodospirillum sp. A1_3_36]|uniref:anthranilate synthase component I n=1 Tax=Rhodospirillum sp. A1_3_36 TaxID=3391666 RepID=UPI0039A6BB48
MPAPFPYENERTATMEEITTQTTPCGLRVRRRRMPLTDPSGIEALIPALDRRRGMVMASTYAYPGRYREGMSAFIDPPLVLEGRDRTASLTALNDRGRVILPTLARCLRSAPGIETVEDSGDRARITLLPMDPWFPEEARSRQPSLFSVVRALIAALRMEDDATFGLYGAFGHDLGLAFERIAQAKPRPADHRDLVLALPDRIWSFDPVGKGGELIEYDFETAEGASTEGLPQATPDTPPPSALANGTEDDMARGTYAGIVAELKGDFAAGDLFEAVPSRLFRRLCPEPPSRLYQRLRADNPAPYVFLANLGGGEHLVGASPEMFLRVTARRVETCPISGTIARGRDALGDAANIKALLNSEKDEAELTMCTDVDRNDKARVCEPGSIRLLGRRQIELYARLIHTVDHVEGTLNADRDALDAFLSHCWAVTVTGAPKRAAMERVEGIEPTVRGWYGGAIGRVGVDGSLDTGLTLRTIRLRNGIAEVRAGATVLHASDPYAEEAETVLKASALLALLDPALEPQGALPRPRSKRMPFPRPRVLLVDHEDSFTHTLASYLRAAGAETTVLRWDFPRPLMAELNPDLVVLSPGPGTPERFRLSETIGLALEQSRPLFGVCLGLQGIVEYFGGGLSRLDTPAHGVESPLRLVVPRDRLFSGLGEGVRVGRYHSLHADRARLPRELAVLAETEDGVIMAVRHRRLPISAVQFHPESLMTTGGDAGARMVGNLLSACGGVGSRPHPVGGDAPKPPFFLGKAGFEEALPPQDLNRGAAPMP